MAHVHHEYGDYQTSSSVMHLTPLVDEFIYANRGSKFNLYTRKSGNGYVFNSPCIQFWFIYVPAHFLLRWYYGPLIKRSALDGIMLEMALRRCLFLITKKLGSWTKYETNSFVDLSSQVGLLLDVPWSGTYKRWACMKLSWFGWVLGFILGLA